MEREMREQRRAYETELEARGVSESRREELLAEFEAEQHRRIRVYEQWFEASLRGERPVP